MAVLSDETRSTVLAGTAILSKHIVSLAARRRMAATPRTRWGKVRQQKKRREQNEIPHLLARLRSGGAFFW